MPNISINKSDLEDLGISLKDILLAITKSKNSSSDVIRIKRKKRKRVKKKSQPKQPLQPKYSRSVAGGGGGGVYNPLPGVYNPLPVVTNVTTNSSTDKDNQIIGIKDQQNYIKNQIEDFKKDNEIKLITQQNQLANFQSMNHLGLRLIYDKIGNPLSNISTTNFREPQPIDRTDRFGIIPSSDFYDNTIGSQFIEEALIQEQVIPDQAIPEPEIQQPEQVIPEPVEPVSFETALEEEVQKEKKKAGRPKGTKNKPKEPSPLTQEAIAQEMELPGTRSSRVTLTNPEMATPDRFAKEHMKKQEAISNFFTPRKIVSRKPISVIPEGEFETEDFTARTPTPPTEAKPSKQSSRGISDPIVMTSKVKSRLPIPSKHRSKSAESASIVFG
jgi:hypothetical protein